MSINACIASRGHPRQLRETLLQTMGNSTLATTTAVIGLDHDDPTAENIKIPQSDKIKICMDDREDSLGAKYNRCALAHPADIYVMLTDDEAISTPRWDERIEEAAKLWTDGFAFVYFGTPPIASSMPAGFAITHKFVERMGFFMTPNHPYWWHDTVTDEIAHFTGRIVHADINMTYPYGYGKTRGLRDVSYWATFHDLTRPNRWKIAEKIIDDPENMDMPGRKLQLKQNVTGLCQHFAGRNASLRDPLKAREFELNQGYDSPADARYERIKAASQVLLATECGIKIEENRAA